MSASSIGQVIDLLAQFGRIPPEWPSGPSAEILLTAAADHCLGAAYAGRCPGVDPDALLHWRAASRAAFQGRPIEAVLADVETSRAALREAPMICLEVEVEGRNLLDHGKLPELPDAQARSGVNVLVRGLSRPGEPGKINAMGAPKWCAAFLGAVQTGRVAGIQVDPKSGYGDPLRGIVGAAIR
jgi:hypothetical protein